MSSCVVCGAKAHGIHFQVNSCRACAAFFRRSLTIGKEYKCRRATQNCDLSEGSKHVCRFCRYQKCLQAGMLYTVQIVSPVHVNGQIRVPVIQSNPGYHNPDTVVAPERSSHITYEDSKLVYDSEPLIAQLKRVFCKPIPHASTLSTMQSLLLTSKNIRPDVKTLNITEVKALDYRVFLQSVEKEILRAAQFAMSCKQFADLPIEEKWFIIQAFWHHYYHIMGVYRTIEAFGRTEPFGYMLTDTLCVREGFTFDLPIEDHKHDQLKEMFTASGEMLKNGIVVPMMTLHLTDFEMVYLQAMVLFNTSRNERITSQTKAISERVIEEICSELHAYYKDEMRIDNYASRLAKIVKLQMELIDLRRFTKDISTMADVFDLFSNSFATSPFYNDI